jgi:ribosomal protein S18 acetylase RimI-like enzyme
MVHMRPARDDEKAQILQLWSDSGLGVTTPEEWEAITAGPGARILVAEKDGVVVGTAVAAFDGWRAYIYHVAVSPVRRGEGLAHELMMHAESVLRRRGATRVYLMVNEANTAGLALSAAMGYEPEGDIAFVRELVPVPALAPA